MTLPAALKRAASLGIVVFSTCADGAPQEYVEAAVCTPCHRGIAESYARTGMGRSFRSVSAANAGAGLSQFDGGRFDHQASREHFTAFRRDGVHYVRRAQTGPDGNPINVVEEPVDYVIGSGNHA